MSAEIEGGIIVGCHGGKLKGIVDVHDFCEEHNLKVMSEIYDADIDMSYVGFEVEQIKTSEINQKWLDNIKELGVKFKTLTGQEASLIGTQNVY